jgi:hypothetical protein
MEVQNHGGTPIMQKSQSPALTCATSWRGCLTRPLQVGLHLNEHFSPRHRSLWPADGCEKRSLCRNRVKKGSPFGGSALELDVHRPHRLHLGRGKRPYSNRSRNDNDDVEDDLFSTSDFKSVRARLLAWEAAIMLSTPLSGISVIAFQLARDTA